VSVVTTEQERPAAPVEAPPAWPLDRFAWGQRPSSAGPWLATIWLVFLLPALADGWRARDSIAGVLGMATTLAFAVSYMSLWTRARESRMRLLLQPPLTVALGYMAVLIALGVVMVLCVGESATAATVFIAVAGVMTLPIRVAVSLVVVLVAAVLSAGQAADWPSQGGVAVGTIAGSFAVLGMRGVISRNIALLRAQEENTRLVVDNERNRFARDLHDILGHSLTVITVKAELAQRLLDADPARARAELADLERLSRDALTDVRRAVNGYREVSLPGELTRARMALGAAEIEARLPQSTDDVPTELRELFAWTVREGVTNVIRHSGARSCEIVLTPTSAEVRDDGRGPGTSVHGSGLTGLRERAAAVDATLVTQALDPGFSLRVTA
jgi:two-component system sensor histidine kinase DesK